MQKIAFIFPCYNEEEILFSSKELILLKFRQLISSNLINSESRVCFVDDGSSDNTWSIIEGFDDKEIIGIKLSRNFGHQFALLAGLSNLKNRFDAYITMDVDLQDDINSLEDMVIEFQKGFDIVYGVRNNRTSDSRFKRTTAEFFYKFMRVLGVKTVYNHADYRLISNKALNEFLKYSESHLFLRGIFPLIGLKQSQIYYKRNPRLLGESKYPLKKMLSFAWEGITSFSIKPLKLITGIGLLALVISIVLSIWALIQLLKGNVITGWTSIVILIIFFGGIQSISMGIIGEYIGKIYIQSKDRPRFSIEKIKQNE